MREEDVSKIFHMEVREKKRIANNIFKRVSTRKGGSNMTAMRVPSQKEQRLLSGEMEVFNLNEIISYEEFLKKPENDQKLLLQHWRERYSNVTITREMGVDSNRFYRLLKKHNIITPAPREVGKIKLSESELKKILSDKNNLMPYEDFKQTVRLQQQTILEEYVNRFNGVVLNLTANWEGADSGYLYNVRRKVKTKETSKPVEKQKNKPEVKQENKPQEVTEVPEVVETIESPAMNEPNPIIEIPEEPTGHTVNINMNKTNEDNENSFSFKLSGQYSKDAIIRRLNLLILELEETEDLLRIDISIEG